MVQMKVVNTLQSFVDIYKKDEIIDVLKVLITDSFFNAVLFTEDEETGEYEIVVLPKDSKSDKDN